MTRSTVVSESNEILQLVGNVLSNELSHMSLIPLSEHWLKSILLLKYGPQNHEVPKTESKILDMKAEEAGMRQQQNEYGPFFDFFCFCWSSITKGQPCIYRGV